MLRSPIVFFVLLLSLFCPLSYLRFSCGVRVGVSERLLPIGSGLFFENVGCWLVVVLQFEAGNNGRGAVQVKGNAGGPPGSWLLEILPDNNDPSVEVSVAQASDGFRDRRGADELHHARAHAEGVV